MMRIIQSIHVTEDYNAARSPSRALRRWKAGKRKVTPFRKRPARKALQFPDGTIVMHPETYQRFRAMAVTGCAGEFGGFGHE